MGYLAGKKLYLSGAIQHSSSPVNWRDEVKKKLSNQFNLDVFDPYVDPKQQWSPDLVAAQKNRNFEEMARIAKLFVRKDLQVVQKTDILVAYLPKDVRTTGVHHEIINSWSYKNPTLLVSNGHKEYIPLWYYGFIDHEYMFDDFLSLYNYLQEVEDGKHKDDLRWAMIYELI